MDGVKLAEWIDAKLMEMGIKKSKFFDETGISSATLSQWRNGQYSPSKSALKKVSEFFGITVSELLGEEQKESAIVSDDALDEELIELLTRLTPAQEEKVVSYIKFLLSNPEA